MMPDIRDINPYAAYDVSSDMWTVHPPELAPDWDPMRSLPAEWWESFGRDAEKAERVVTSFNSLADELHKFHQGDPRWINTATALHHVIGEGAQTFSEIHAQRHDSFQPGGGGYLGYSNVRWQSAKNSGFLHNLHVLKDLWTSAHAYLMEDCTGKVPLDTNHALTIAALVGAGITP